MAALFDQAARQGAAVTDFINYPLHTISVADTSGGYSSRDTVCVDTPCRGDLLIMGRLCLAGIVARSCYRSVIVPVIDNIIAKNY
jgi:hypothetical protein